MAENKRKRSEPSVHRIPALGDMPLDELARLPDEQFQAYLNANGFQEAALCYRANPDFILREIAGEKIAVPVNASAQQLDGVICFTETGCFLWKQLLKDACTKEELSVALTREYDVSKETAVADVAEFISKAAARNLVLIA